MASVVGRDEVEWIQVGDLVARVIAQTCRQSGLSVVHTELLDFGGDEIYFHEEPALEGKSVGEALLAFEKSAVMGYCPAGGAPRLNPPLDTVLGKGDRLIVIAEDDDKIHFTGNAFAIQEEAIAPPAVTASVPSRTLILGWNWRGSAILHELENYVAPGSEAVVVADAEGAEEEVRRCCSRLDRQKVSFRQGDTTDRSTLEELERYDHVILLSYSDALPVQRADARTLISLLHLRDIAEKRGCRFSIVSEVLDTRNRNLAEITRADDFIVSERLVSLMLAQVSENKALNAVFADLFDPEGSEIYLKPAGLYVNPGQPVSFYTVVEAARRRGEVAIGYRRVELAHDAERSYGVVINPAKSEPVGLGQDDRVIVLAEE